MDYTDTRCGPGLVDLYLIGQSLSHFRREKCGSGEVNRSLLNGKLITVAANNYIALAKITDKPLCYRVQNTIARDCGLCMSLTVTLLLASTRMIVQRLVALRRNISSTIGDPKPEARANALRA